MRKSVICVFTVALIFVFGAAVKDSFFSDDKKELSALQPSDQKQLGALFMLAVNDPQAQKAPLEVTIHPASWQFPSQKVMRREKVNRLARLAPLRISDRDYSGLSAKWKRGVSWLLLTGRCSKYDSVIDAVVQDPQKRLIAKAQMIVESSCKPMATSVVDARGLFQVKEIACRDVGMEGDLYDPAFNAKCAAKYREALCKRYGYCNTASLMVAYNVGPTGAKHIPDKRSHRYVRKLEFVLEQLTRKGRMQISHRD